MIAGVSCVEFDFLINKKCRPFFTGTANPRKKQLTRVKMLILRMLVLKMSYVDPNGVFPVAACRRSRLVDFFHAYMFET